MSFTTKQSESKAPGVPEVATQGAEAHRRDWTWVEASVWNERMLAALANGVKGGKWFSLIDKVYRVETLKAAWQKVAANGGAAGVDGQSVKQFAARAEMYLEGTEPSAGAGNLQADGGAAGGDSQGERKEASSGNTGS